MCDVTGGREDADAGSAEANLNLLHFAPPEEFPRRTMSAASIIIFRGRNLQVSLTIEPARLAKHLHRQSNPEAVHAIY